jgi:hypothetical protein
MARTGDIFLPSKKRTDTPWGPHSPYSMGTAILSWGKAAGAWSWPLNFHPVPRLRISGAILLRSLDKDKFTLGTKQHKTNNTTGFLISIRKVGRAVTSRSRRDADEICALLGCYAASSGNPIPTFRDKVSVPSSGVNKSKLLFLDFLSLEDGTDTLSRNVGKGFVFGPLDPWRWDRYVVPKRR